MGPAIRDAQSEDAAAVAALLGELGYPASAAQASARLERLAADPATRTVVATLDGEVVGVAALHVMHIVEDDAPGAQLIAIVVSGRHRRHGVGAALMQALEDEARARGCGVVALGTGLRRADAHAFYERLGYAFSGRRYKKRLD